MERQTINDVLPLFERKEVLAITGVRRSGKTCMMYLLIKRLLQSGTRPEQVLYLNLDDPSLDGLGLDRLISGYEETVQPKGKMYIFLDEVQSMDGWERWIKRFYDSHKDMKVVVSGSNSSLLRTEFSKYLAGRHLTFELYPLSFVELLGFKGVHPKNRAEVIDMRSVVLHHLEDYLQYGGFPEVALETDASKRTAILKEYFSTILARDVLSRPDVRDTRGMERVATFLATNASNPISAKSMGNVLGLNTRTVQEYLDHLQDVYMFLQVNHFSYSLKAQYTYPRKVYSIDPGMANAVSLGMDGAKARSLENAVFLALQAKGRVYYWKDQGAEVDFVVTSGRAVTQIVQSCLDPMAKDTRKRGLKGLSNAMRRFKKKTSLIVTWDEEGEEKVDGGTVTLVPMWQWLLGI